MNAPERAPDRFDLQTLGGIATARERIFNQLLAGEISEPRAGVAEKILRGQQSLRGEIPIKFLGLITRHRSNPGLESFTTRLAERVGEFIGATGTAAIADGGNATEPTAAG